MSRLILCKGGANPCLMAFAKMGVMESGRRKLPLDFFPDYSPYKSSFSLSLLQSRLGPTSMQVVWLHLPHTKTTMQRPTFAT